MCETLRILKPRPSFRETNVSFILLYIVQVQYQLVFCLWVLTFNPLLAEKMNKFNAIPILADILSDSVKEKVTRIVLAVFRNLIEKPEDQQVC